MHLCFGDTALRVQEFGAPHDTRLVEPIVGNREAIRLARVNLE